MHSYLEISPHRAATLSLDLSFPLRVGENLVRTAKRAAARRLGLDVHDARSADVMGGCDLEGLDSLSMVDIARLHPESLLVTCLG